MYWQLQAQISSLASLQERLLACRHFLFLQISHVQTCGLQGQIGRFWPTSAEKDRGPRAPGPGPFFIKWPCSLGLCCVFFAIPYYIVWYYFMTSYSTTHPYVTSYHITSFGVIWYKWVCHNKPYYTAPYYGILHHTMRYTHIILHYIIFYCIILYCNIPSPALYSIVLWCSSLD